MKITKDEIYLWNNGKFYNAYLRFGAHKSQIGVEFTVFAPNAYKVYVSGDFNDWQPIAMEHIDSGIYYAHIMDIRLGSLYKYIIEDSRGGKTYKADPFAFFSEIRPKTASVVYDLKPNINKTYKPHNKDKLNIYEVHLGSWRLKDNGEFYTYRELADILVPYVKDMNYTHIEIMPLSEHPFDGSWGYQCTGYYSITSRYGSPDDFIYLVNAFHRNGIGVILDWVGGHFCPDEHGLALFDGTHLYEYEKHNHWGTYKFDFKKPFVHSFLISNIMFLIDYFNIDGIRVDGVSSMLYLNFDNNNLATNKYGGYENLEAIDFFKALNTVVRSNYKDVLMIAEESTNFPLVTAPAHAGGLGFTHKWDLGFMNDTLSYMQADFNLREYIHNKITFSSVYRHSEKFLLPFSHDEVVHGKKSMIDKMPGNIHEKLAGLKTLYMYQLTFPGAKLSFMGSEFAQFIEWKYYEQLEWFMLKYPHHQKFKDFTREANLFYKQYAALSDNENLEWIDADNKEQKIFIYTREDNSGHKILVIINMADIAYDNFRVGSYFNEIYKEVFNTDYKQYSGSGKHLNKYPTITENIPFHGKNHSAVFNIPPLSALCFTFARKDLNDI